MSDFQRQVPSSSDIGRQYQSAYLPSHDQACMPQTRAPSQQDFVALGHEMEYYKEQLEHSESQRESMQNRLDTARAQERHDRDMITGLQTRIQELERMVERHSLEADARVSSIALINANSDLEQFVDPDSSNEGNSSLSRRMSMQETLGLSPTTRYQNVFGQPPPRFNLNATMARAGSDGIDTASQEHLNLDSIPNSGAGTGTGTGTGTGSGSGGTPCLPTNQLSFGTLTIRQPQQVIHLQDPPFSEKEFSKKLARIWTASKCFAMKYTDTNFRYDEDILGQNVLAFLNLASDGSAELLSNVSTRYLMISKAVNWYIVKTVLKISVISGFDPNVDSEIRQMSTHLNPATPYTIKNAMIRGICQHILMLRNRPLFDNFFNKRTHEHTLQLFQLLSPLIYARDQGAWCALGGIMVEAHGLALAMYSGPYEFKFFHPSCRDHFDPRYMTDHNAGTGEDWTMQHAKRKYTVKLAITPVPFFRNVILHPEATLQALHLGDVLLGPEVGQR